MLAAQSLTDLLPQAFVKPRLPLPHLHSGKVRESYALNNGLRLIVTTDRLSAFDRVLAGVPYKGQVLNQLAMWWFKHMVDIVPHHALSTPDANALVAVETQPFPVEVVVRGYITGVTSTALWHRYAQGERHIYGYTLPPGLRKNESLPEPIITPTTKGGPTGHDERLTCQEVVTRGLIDARTWDEIQAAALALFKRGQKIARTGGLILVDTKYEFGRAPDGRLMLIDEVHTPDSSRYWLADSYPEHFAVGAEPENFDKEFVRLEYAKRGYRGEGDPPAMPDSLWLAASQRYMSAWEILTGHYFEPGDYPVEPRLLSNLRKAGLVFG